MTTEKSIERLSNLSKPTTWIYFEEDLPALKLGIEALKLIDWIRQGGIPTSSFLLPSETVD